MINLETLKNTEVFTPAQGRVFRMAVTVRLVHWMVICLLTVILGTLFVLRPLRFNLAKAKLEHQDVKNKVLKTLQVARDEKNIDVVINQFSTELGMLKAKTLHSGEQSQVTMLLTEATESFGISILSMMPVTERTDKKKTEVPVPREPLEPIRFEIELEGGYRAIGDFFDYLKRAPLVMTVEAFDINPTESDQKTLNMKLLLAAYQETL